jgi:hypothetical protein
MSACGKDINNPKIPIKLVRERGELLFHSKIFKLCVAGKCV